MGDIVHQNLNGSCERPADHSTALFECQSYTIKCRVVSEDRRAEALQRGLKHRHFFAHRFYVLPKCGPDALKTFFRLGLRPSIESSWQLLLYAAPELTDDLPNDLHFGSDIQWHQQHLGHRGLVASANLWIDGDRLFSAVHLSDLVHRISRRRQFKTIVERRFKGWHRLLLNAVANVAIERRLRILMLPSAAAVLRLTDRFRRRRATLFTRIYDADVGAMFHATPLGPWWRVELAHNRQRILPAVQCTETASSTKTICLCHDIEGGSGHAHARRSVVWHMNKTADDVLKRMLDVEARVGVSATYSVVGNRMRRVRMQVDPTHALAFHSYDHRRPALLSSTLLRLARVFGSRAHLFEPYDYQLARCRMVDYRIKGYRPPQSHVGDITPDMLCFFNFEWLTSSARSLSYRQPTMQDRVAWLPLHFDDYNLHRGWMSYAMWERMALWRVRRSGYTAFSLHDCYAPHWLGQYERLLQQVRDEGRLRTLDEVAADVILASAL